MWRGGFGLHISRRNAPPRGASTTRATAWPDPSCRRSDFCSGRAGRRRHQKSRLLMKARHRAHALLDAVELGKQNAARPKQRLPDGLKVRMTFTNSSMRPAKLVRVVLPTCSPEPRQNPAQAVLEIQQLALHQRASALRGSPGPRSTCSGPAETSRAESGAPFCARCCGPTSPASP
jgi:hypothetical protein